MKKKEMNYETISSGLIGFAIGDALGVPVEFIDRESLTRRTIKDMIGFGSHHVPEGTWSDDTSMTIATMDSICEKNDLNFDDIMQKYCSWFQHANYTATGLLFDIGIGTQKALTSYYCHKTSAIESGETDIRNNGNGSLMRMLPIVYYLHCAGFSEEKNVEFINHYSSLTHGHEISRLGCKIYYDYMHALLNGSSKEEAFKNLQSIDYSKYYSQDSIYEYQRILNGRLIDVNITSIESSGYIVSTLEACLWTVLHSHDYEEALIKAVNLGNDTDTIGAITGSIAGTLYGVDSIPNRWISQLRKLEYLKELSQRFVDVITHKFSRNSKHSSDDDEYDRFHDIGVFNHNPELFKMLTSEVDIEQGDKKN